MYGKGPLGPIPPTRRARRLLWGVISRTIVAEPSLTDLLDMLLGIGRWIDEAWANSRGTECDVTTFGIRNCLRVDYCGRTLDSLDKEPLVRRLVLVDLDLQNVKCY